MQRKGQPTAHQVDNRPTAIAQRKLQASINATVGPPIQLVRTGPPSSSSGKNKKTKGDDKKKGPNADAETKTVKAEFEVSQDNIIGLKEIDAQRESDIATYLTSDLYKALKEIAGGEILDPNLENKLRQKIRQYPNVVVANKVNFILKEFIKIYNTADVSNLLSADDLALLSKGGDLANPGKELKKSATVDITEAFNSQKACAITALMYVEGNVLGATSVAALHKILVTYYKDSWRHYSEPRVYGSLYQYLGYKSTGGSGGKLKDLNPDTLPAQGMIHVEGSIEHMIGYKKQGNKLSIKDNEGGNKYADAIVKNIWSK